MTLTLGQPAPDFALTQTDGSTVRLSDFRGQWVVLYFYPRDNTPGCTKEACGFRDRYDAFTEKGIQVLGVSADTEAAHRKFRDKFDLPFPLLCDLDTSVAQRYDSYGPKKFMGKTYEGIFRKTFLIDPNGILVKIYPKVKPEPHAGEVLEDITTLMNP